MEAMTDSRTPNFGVMSGAPGGVPASMLAHELVNDSCGKEDREGVSQ